MDPREDQYIAAMREAQSIVQREGRRLSALAFEPDREEVPAEVMRWMRRYAADLSVLRKCPHGDLSRVHVIFGCEPNRAYCVQKCLDKRARQLYRDAKHRTSMDCDFCGVHYERAALYAVVFNVAAIVVRAFACGGCLAPATAARS